MSASLPVVQNFVHGRFLANSTGETFPVMNPATGQVIYEVEVADESVQQAAIESARAGFAQWAATPAIERSRILLNAVALLRERNDELAAVEVRDTGKPWQEAEAVDVVTGADAIEFFAGLAPSIEGNQQDLGAISITPGGSRWASVRALVPGTIRSRSPAGSRPRPWPAATP